MDFDLEFANPEEKEALDENEDGAGENQPNDGEKSNKCYQCDYASSYASALKTHLKTHGGEKTNKCNQCDYALDNAQWRKDKQMQSM